MILERTLDTRFSIYSALGLSLEPYTNSSAESLTKSTYNLYQLYINYINYK